MSWRKDHVIYRYPILTTSAIDGIWRPRRHRVFEFAVTESSRPSSDPYFHAARDRFVKSRKPLRRQTERVSGRKRNPFPSSPRKRWKLSSQTFSPERADEPSMGPAPDHPTDHEEGDGDNGDDRDSSFDRASEFDDLFCYLVGKPTLWWASASDETEREWMSQNELLSSQAFVVPDLRMSAGKVAWIVRLFLCH